MLKLIVPDMTCGHCASAIKNAVAGIDKNAAVAVDLANHAVSVTSDEGTDKIRAAIENAGYTVSVEQQEKSSSSCCGSCR